MSATNTQFFSSFEEAKSSPTSHSQQSLNSGILTVTVLQAKELLPVDSLSNSSDPYVILQLNAANRDLEEQQDASQQQQQHVTRYQTDIIFNTCDPVFNESFSFPVRDLHSDVLYICVVHDNAHVETEPSQQQETEDSGIDNVGIGNAEIVLADLVEKHIANAQQSFETWIKLTDVESGYLQLGFRFARKSLE